MSTSQFAIAAHALAALAHDGGGAPVDVLAESVNTPPSFLRSIMARLQHAGLVEAREGGGYHLTRPAEGITLQQVHDALTAEGVSLVVGSKATIRGALDAIVARAGKAGPAGLAEYSVQDLARMAFGEHAVPYVDAHSFDARVLQAKRPVLVEFTASWCGPCKELAPVLDELAAASGANYDVVRVDIDDAPVIARRYSIRGLPTVIAFVEGEPVAQHVGVTGGAALRDLLKR